jgi:hypothetical protein
MSNSNDQASKESKYYIKNLDRTQGTVGAYDAPNWCIYERLDASRGSIAVCLCYDEPMAQHFMGLLNEGAPLPAGLDDTGTI